MFRMRKTAVALALVGAIGLATLPSEPAHATGFPVVDIANLSQNLITAIQEVMSVANQITSLVHEVNMIQNQIKTLQRLPDSFKSIVDGNLTSSVSDLQSLLGSVNGINYTLNQVQDQYKELFPESGDWESIDMTQMAEMTKQWQKTISNASVTAMQAQSVLARVQTNNQQAQDVLANISGADGEVRQLQGTNAMLGVLNNQIGDLTTTLATSARLTATVQATANAKEQQKQEDYQRRIKNYYSVPVTSSLSDLPPIKD